ncbi:TPA: hypothetical protein NG682_004859 [Vibrio parahaemolyticus]|uniref:hypothetical protein n=1 Tax=Vibrio parahaemolyticus TaxID=670 RepID=UPI0011205A9B|nr:hypothetical protein [Vibrio parahaemolyticus]MDF4941945.1 hypothetical protein [Vibrio parahaemolyticus]TOK31560.1 hypothetical protein CGI20_25970 [Vibrio parahaemolyticus]HCE3706043.1 hypothetical protein [Vibrio parahaemolyticus]HCG6654745.1 hypothetical protein [Vibrio parahaemolyticus]
MNKVSFLIALAVTLSFTAVASDFTLKIHKSGGGSKKYCYVDFEIDLDGNWTSKALYSNGHQLHSMRFISDLIVKTKDGRDVLTITQNHHVKGSGGGSAREETTSEKGKLPAEVATMISKDKTSMTCRTYDDKIGQQLLDNLDEMVRVAGWISAL